MSTTSNFDQCASSAQTSKQKFTLSPKLVAELKDNLPPSPVAAPNKIAQALKKPVTPVALVAKQVINVSNAEFVSAIFGTPPQGAHPALCSKRGDPTTGNWYPMTAGATNLQTPNDRNNYINCSSFNADEMGNFQARKDRFAAMHFVLLDDVGSKVPLSELCAVPPSFLIETSPGNFQVGYILAQPLTDQNEATRFIQAIIARKLSDPGATGVARWARLPNGINGKEKYKSETGQAFQCRLVRWNPERRYTVQEIVCGLKLDMSEAKVALSGDVSKVMASAPRELNRADIAKLPKLLAAIDPDCARPDWMNAMMAVHHTTQGGDDGFALFDAWSSKGKKYRGSKDVEVQWKSLQGHKGPCITIGTLIKMAREAGMDVRDITRTQAPAITVSTASAVNKSMPITAVVNESPLLQYSLRDDLEELERNLVMQIQILGQLVLLGQATVIYALAGTGKTLIILYLIIQAIKQGLLDPSKVFYINMDDNGAGVVDKVRLAAEYGFHLAADGHKGFQAADFRASMEQMIADDTAAGVIVVLDTLKKFVDTMRKSESADFAKVVRQFVLKGGTVVALGHANKNPGADGRIVYSGTTDILDDFDCGFTMATVAQDTDPTQKVVEFRNIKRRGNVALSAAYSYALEPSLPYAELLLSVQQVDVSQLALLKQTVPSQTDAAIIAAIEACISEGTHSKMKLVDAASHRVWVSGRAALAILEKYTGDDPALHRWTFAVRERGAKVYQLLPRPEAQATSANEVAQTSTPTPAASLDSELVKDAADQLAHASILEYATALLDLPPPVDTESLGYLSY